jgi:hypothetical protein
VLNSSNINSIFINTPYYPIGKYFYLQDKIAETDEIAKEDIVESFIKANPKWILTSTPLIDCKLLSAHSDDYEIVFDKWINSNVSRLIIYHKLSE